MKLRYSSFLVACFVCAGGHLTAQTAHPRQSVLPGSQVASVEDTHRFPVLAGDSLTLTIDLHRPRLSAKTVLSRFVPFWAMGAFGRRKTNNQQDGNLSGTPPTLSAGILATLPGMLGGRGRHRDGFSVTYLSMTGKPLISEFVPVNPRQRRADLVLKPERSGFVEVQFVGKRKAEVGSISARSGNRQRQISIADLPERNVATTGMVADDREDPIEFPKDSWLTGQDPSNGSSGGGGPADPIAYDGLNPADFPDFNLCEFVYVAQNPEIVSALITNRSYVEHIFNVAGDWNGHSSSSVNAAKHALLQALNYCAIGKKHTVEMANRHEICQGKNMNPSEEELIMDQRNNAMGIIIGERSGCPSASDLWALVKLAYFTGELFKIDGKPTP